MHTYSLLYCPLPTASPSSHVGTPLRTAGSLTAGVLLCLRKKKKKSLKKRHHTAPDAFLRLWKPLVSAAGVGTVCSCPPTLVRACPRLLIAWCLRLCGCCFMEVSQIKSSWKTSIAYTSRSDCKLIPYAPVINVNPWVCPRHPLLMNNWASWSTLPTWICEGFCKFNCFWVFFSVCWSWWGV